MKIVVLDGYTLNPGDLSWEELHRLGDCVIHDRTPPELVVERARETDIILTNKALVDRAAIAALPKLRFIAVLATGYNTVDVVAARERGIPVSNVPAYGASSVSQQTFALLLELAQHVGHHADTVRASRWVHSPDWCYWDRPLLELDGLTIGIVGFGHIGQGVARLARAFGMNLLAHTRTPPREPPPDVRFVDLETLFRTSDVVTLHCPLTSETKNLVNPERLAWMKPTAVLLNTSRGPLIDEAALADALNSGRLAGAGLDVLSTEPPRPDNPLLTARNCLITPHQAWATRAARQRLLRTVVENVRAFVGGKPQNVVNKLPINPAAA
jgi:glycerate dehydrogenase